MVLEMVGGYLAAGLVSLLIGPIAKRFRWEVRDVTKGDGVEPWKIAAFAATMSASVMLCWPIFILEFYREFQQLRHASRNLRAVSEVMGAMAAMGIDADGFCNGRGGFGLSEENPIPTRALTGSRNYLARLATLDGQRVTYERRGSRYSSVSEGMVDIYEIADSTGKHIAEIYISPYNRRTSSKPPEGFQLAVGIDVL